MRLQLHHCPLPLRGAAGGLRGETADWGDGGRGRGEGRQQTGPQAALQGAQSSSCTPWQQQQGGATVSVQQQRLINQLLDYVHFLAPVQVQGWGALWRPGRAGGAGRVGGVWREAVWERRVSVFVLVWPLGFTAGLLICSWFKLFWDILLLCFIFILVFTVLQGFIYGAEARGGGQQCCVLQLLLPLHDQLSPFQLLLLLLQLQLQLFPLLQLLFLSSYLLLHLYLFHFPSFLLLLLPGLLFVPLQFFLCLLLLLPLLLFSSPLPLLLGLLQWPALLLPALLQLQQLPLVLLQPAELRAPGLLPGAPGGEVGAAQLGRGDGGDVRFDDVAVDPGVRGVIAAVLVRQCREACVRERKQEAWLQKWHPGVRQQGRAVTSGEGVQKKKGSTVKPSPKGLPAAPKGSELENKGQTFGVWGQSTESRERWPKERHWGWLKCWKICAESKSANLEWFDFISRCETQKRKIDFFYVQKEN